VVRSCAPKMTALTGEVLLGGNWRCTALRGAAGGGDSFAEHAHEAGFVIFCLALLVAAFGEPWFLTASRAWHPGQVMGC